jgi:hypothetical protein
MKCLALIVVANRWTFAKFITLKREQRTWQRAHLEAAENDKEEGGILGGLLKEIADKQKAKAEDLEEKETLGRIAELYRTLEEHGWGETEAEGLSVEEGKELRAAVAELLRRVAWRRNPRGRNKWGWTKVGGKGAPGVFFATPEEASLYLLVKYASARRALEEGARPRKGKLNGPTGKPEIDERLRRWRL